MLASFFIRHENKKKQMFLTSDGLGNFKLRTLQKFQTYSQNRFDQNLQIDFNAKIEQNPHFKLGNGRVAD